MGHIGGNGGRLRYKSTLLSVMKRTSAVEPAASVVSTMSTIVSKKGSTHAYH